jgi:DNA polymerase-3 subunit gamma/tau
VIQAVPSAADDADHETAEMARLASLMPADETQLLYSLCLHGRAELGLAPDEYAGLTMVLLRLLAFKGPRPEPIERAPEKKTLSESARAAVTAAGVPPGQVLRVVEVAAAQTAQPRRAGGGGNGRPAGEVVGVPVRVQAESARETVPAGAAALVPTEDGDFWLLTVGNLVAHEAVTALARELALQSQLVGRDEGHWMLRVERESLNQPASRERLQNALEGAGHKVNISVEVGGVTDSPARRIAAAAAQKQRAAEEIIQSDPFVQTMMREFGAKIVPGSIKPVQMNDAADSTN